MITRNKALKIRSLIMNSAGEMNDANASVVPEIFPRLKDNGALVSAGTRINWKGQLKKANADTWDTAENNPDNAPTLWEDLNYMNGYRVIPETITVTTSFSKGEKGWWRDSAYESIYDGLNVWTPIQFPAGWSKITE